MAMIISGFPGVGKSWLTENVKHLKVLDSDSSNFSWTEPGKTRNPDFPKNYIEHIKANLSTADIILISSHKEVRDALQEAGILFNLVYPLPSLRQEYLLRYANRGNNTSFLTMMSENFTKFVKELQNQKGCLHTPLQEGQFLKDILTL